MRSKLKVRLVVLGLLFAGVAAAGDGIKVVNEGGIKDAWILAPGAALPAPAYPQAYASAPAEACVAIGYLLNADGTTSDFAMLNAWSAGEPKQGREEYWSTFADDSSRALAHWKFAPRPDVVSPKPVYTVATFLFASKNPTELRKRCAIPDLAMRLIELRHDARLSRRMSGQDIFARLDIDPALENRYREMERKNAAHLRPGGKVQEQPIPPPTSSQNPPSGG